MKPMLLPLQTRWATLAPREQTLVRLAGAVVLLGLLWFVGLQPAWRTWREVPPQREALEAQFLGMQRLAAEARELKAQPAVSGEQSRLALKAATDRLGSKVKLNVVADRATLNVTDLSPAALTGWLAEVRSGARARPIDMQLSRSQAGLSGQVVVSLPASAAP
ncbi:type II secretion system protein GspM [Ideonella alba]|nr:type II secretion system protein GspM [Ideonella alba]